MTNVSQDEYAMYWEMLQKKHNRKLKELSVDVDGDFVNLTYKFEPVQFERIRRITGYLTGNTTTWNAAKTAELKDRIPHGGIEKL